MQNTDVQWLLKLTTARKTDNNTESETIQYFLDPRQETIIGRAPNCQIVIDSVIYPTVSRQHIKICFINEESRSRWEVCDLNATNGTFVNDERLSGCQILKLGDRILLGKDGAELVFANKKLNHSGLSSRQTIEEETKLIAKFPPKTLTAKPKTEIKRAERRKQAPAKPPTSDRTVFVAPKFEQPIPETSTSEYTSFGEIRSSPSTISPEPSKPEPSKIEIVPVAKGQANKSLWDPIVEDNVRILGGHSETIKAVSFSPDGRLLASGSEDRIVKLWHLATGREIQTIAAHDMAVTALAFSPIPPNPLIQGSEGGILASGSVDRTIKIWNLITGQPIQAIVAHEMVVNALAFSPNGQILASGSSDNTVKLWDLARGREIQTLLKTTAPVNALTFSTISPSLAPKHGKGEMLAVASADRSIRLINLNTGKEIVLISDISSAVNSLVFSPNGRILASGSNDKTIKLWDLDTEKELRTISGYFWQVGSLAISGDGQKFASGSDDRSVRTWCL
jgi:pSer/pThr/pTyr-binding forkhead associated (FHA) protein